LRLAKAKKMGAHGSDDEKVITLNRELSWLEFNRRVLSEACDVTVPLAERLKFQGIVCSNLDEFFMVRVAGLRQLVASGVKETNADGLTPSEQLVRISSTAHAMLEQLYQNWRTDIAPGLDAKAGIQFLKPTDLDDAQRTELELRFSRDIWPVLTPLAVDQGHPFPVLRNRSLNLGILLHRERKRVARRSSIVAVVQVPTVLDRLVKVPPGEDGKTSYILLEDLIAMHVGGLFPGFRVVGCSPFRLTRNFDLAIDEDEADDLLKTIQRELRKRERGQAVRLEIAHDAPIELEAFLRSALKLDPVDVYRLNGPLRISDFMGLTSHERLSAFHDEAFVPQLSPLLQDADIFRVLAERDVLLHHPYQSFDHVVDFISDAADDPHVLAIKQTLYRTNVDSPIIQALTRAAENGKQVTAVVELKARFDEGRNIAWARVLEAAGVHVVYGLPGLKTHSKVSLVVRKEGDFIRRYVHLSTGNYNPSTARLYGDISYFTSREPFADDAGALFNLITGYSTPPTWKRFFVAPLGFKERIIELIEKETAAGPDGRIIAKMNSLVDADVIGKLYAASAAGVRIDLLIRGICCLRPGIVGLSENIRVRSTVDRFLEHARIFYFKAEGKDELYLSSADWMPRNFVRRVEIMFPIEDETLRARILHEILGGMMTDNTKSWNLFPDGSYERILPEDGESPVRSQQNFIDLAKEQAAPVQVDRGVELTPTVRLATLEDQPPSPSLKAN